MVLRPYSPRFAEHYWSPAGGVAEKYAVFIEGNQLPARIANLRSGQALGVAELGLGTGLNWALTAQAFASRAPAHAQLNYYGYEAYPLSVAELQDIHTGLPPELQPWLAPLQAAWPHLRLGLQTYTWPNATLHLWVGEALEGIAQQPGKVDAWYLDGFSPVKNPDLWSLPLLQQVAAHSNPGATAATYSVARLVRDNLTAAGFTVEKKAGVPPKRDRLEARLKG